MAKNWWFKFDFRVWRTDSNLRRCSLETRGFWLDVLCVMHETGEYELSGTYEELARLVGCESAEVARCAAELKRTKTSDVTLGNGFVTLLSRRLKRELKDREQTRLRVQRSRGNADVTPVKHDRVISKSKKEEIREELRGTKEAVRPPARSAISTSTHVDLFLKTFPNYHPPIFLQETIHARVTDLTIWSKALQFWKANDYRPASVGKLCDKYDEIQKEQLNGINKQPNFREQRATTAVRDRNVINELRQRERDRAAGLLGDGITDSVGLIRPV